MPEYRIIFKHLKGDPCCWQLQKRKYLFFWIDVYIPFSSATFAAREMLKLMNDL